MVNSTGVPVANYESGGDAVGWTSDMLTVSVCYQAVTIQTHAGKHGLLTELDKTLTRLP